MGTILIYIQFFILNETHRKTESIFSFSCLLFIFVLFFIFIIIFSFSCPLFIFVLLFIFIIIFSFSCPLFIFVLLFIFIIKTFSVKSFCIMENVLWKRRCEDEYLRKMFSTEGDMENVFRKLSSSHSLFRKTFFIIQKLFTEKYFP